LEREVKAFRVAEELGREREGRTSLADLSHDESLEGLPLLARCEIEGGWRRNNVEGGRSRSRETEKGREGGRKEMMVRGELAKAAEVRGLPLPFFISSFFPPKTLCYSPDHRKTVEEFRMIEIECWKSPNY